MRLKLKEKLNTIKNLRGVKLVREIAKRYSKHSISAYSAQMAFFMVLAVFPFLIFLINVLGRFSLDTEMVVKTLEIFFPKEVHGLVLGMLNDYILTSDNSILSLSVLGTIWSASKGVRGLMRALNRAYGIKETRKYIIVKAMDMFYTIAFVVMILFLLALPNIGRGFFDFINKYINVQITEEYYNIYNMFKIITLPTSLVFIMCSVYLITPNVKLKLRDVLWGSIFSIIGWAVLSFSFSIFINNFANYSLVYGGLTTFIIMMLWFYFSGIVLMIGGEINSVVWEKRNNKKYLIAD